MDASQIGKHAWSYAGVLQDAGLTYFEYVEQLTLQATMAREKLALLEGGRWWNEAIFLLHSRRFTKSARVNRNSI